MRVNYGVNATPQFRVLSNDQIETIYFAALRVLERVGAQMHDPDSVRLLRGAGAFVEDEDRVRFPPAMVEAALRTVPQKVTLTGRSGYSIHLEKNEIHFGTGSDTPFTIDPYTDERRRCTSQDVYNWAKIADASEHVDFFMSLGLVSDVPMLTYDRHQFLAMLEGTGKPLIITAVDQEGLADQHQMACALLGGEEAFRQRPMFAIYIEPSSPLTHFVEVLQKLRYAAEKGIPAIYTPCPMCGGTAPVTLAGLLVQTLAESFAGLVVNQLTRPGAPVIIGGFMSIFDMATTIMCYGAPEMALMSAAMTDITKWLGIPMFSTAGCSDAKVLDEQAAIEATGSLLTAALSGANLIHDLGYLESGLVGSGDMLVMCNETIGYVKRILRGVQVDEESLAVDVIDRVGPSGEYLTDKHTLHRFKQEFWFPTLIDREGYENWADRGRKPMRQRVREKVLDIIENYEPQPIAGDVLERMKAIVAAADERHKSEEDVSLL